MNPLDRFNCEQVFKRLDDYLDHELTPQEMKLIEEHLEICAWCAGAYDFQAGVINELRQRLQHIPAPDRLREKVANALKKVRDEPNL